jgi:hypothetical protein
VCLAQKNLGSHNDYVKAPVRGERKAERIGTRSNEGYGRQCPVAAGIINRTLSAAGVICAPSEGGRCGKSDGVSRTFG